MWNHIEEVNVLKISSEGDTFVARHAAVKEHDLLSTSRAGQDDRPHAIALWRRRALQGVGIDLDPLRTPQTQNPLINYQAASFNTLKMWTPFASREMHSASILAFLPWL